MITAVQAKAIADAAEKADVYELIRVYATKGEYSLKYNGTITNTIYNDLVSKGYIISGVSSPLIEWF